MSAGGWTKRTSAALFAGGLAGLSGRAAAMSAGWFGWTKRANAALSAGGWTERTSGSDVRGAVQLGGADKRSVVRGAVQLDEADERSVVRGAVQLDEADERCVVRGRFGWAERASTTLSAGSSAGQSGRALRCPRAVRLGRADERSVVRGAVRLDEADERCVVRRRFVWAERTSAAMSAGSLAGRSGRAQRCPLCNSHFAFFAGRRRNTRPSEFSPVLQTRTATPIRIFNCTEQPGCSLFPAATRISIQQKPHARHGANSTIQKAAQPFGRAALRAFSAPLRNS